MKLLLRRTLVRFDNNATRKISLGTSIANAQGFAAKLAPVGERTSE